MAPRITRPLTILNLKMPADFSVKSYESCYARVEQKAEVISHSSMWVSEFSPAWLAIAYRFRSCAECDRAFTASIKRAGSTPDEPERYFQERDLFNFFVSGLSALESFSYGLYFIGFALEPQVFTLAASDKTYKRIDLEKTVVPSFVKSSFGSERITSELKCLLSQAEYTQWSAIRNKLAHRITPVRTGVHSFIESVGPNYSGSTYSHEVLWLDGLTIDKHTTATWRVWLAKTLKSLFGTVDVFFNRKL